MGTAKLKKVAARVGFRPKCGNRQNVSTNRLMKRQIIVLATILMLGTQLQAQDEKKGNESDNGSEKAAESIFPDSNLEEAVREYVFDKRGTDKAIVGEDVGSISTVKARGSGIKDLTGLGHCRSLASLDLAKNSVGNLKPLEELTNVQYLDLAHNQVESIAPLKNVTALQYLKLTGNRVSDLKPLASLSNLRSAYFSDNRIADPRPLWELSELTTLYLADNEIESVEGINALKELRMLSLKGNKLTSVKPLQGLTELRFLFLQENQIADVSPLVGMLRQDLDGKNRFAPFIEIHLAGNPLSESSINALKKLKAAGVEIHLQPRKEEQKAASEDEPATNQSTR